MKKIAKIMVSMAGALCTCALWSCSNGGAETNAVAGAETSAQTSEAQQITGDFGTIIHNVYLKPEFTDDPAYAEMLADFNREAFVDSIFEAIYHNFAKVTDMEGNPMTVEQVKDLEFSNPAFTRDKVAGIQFVERWSFDPKTQQMQKKVESMLIGYELMDNGVIVGFRPGFKIYMK